MPDNKVQRGGRFEKFRESLEDAAFEYRLQEAQQRYDAAEPGGCIQIDADLVPYINRTDKDAVMYSDELTDFPKGEA